jgi:IMP dehydrogenase
MTLPDLKFTFDDFLIVPSYSRVYDVFCDIASRFFDHELRVPIISSPMDTITGKRMITEIYKAGGFGIHHRYCTLEDMKFSAINSIGGFAISPSMGISAVMQLQEWVHPLKLIVVVDVGHGHSEEVLSFCRRLVNEQINAISGNVCTVQAALNYLDIGVEYLRVGVGSGSVCITRQVTGIGYPQGSAIEEISKLKEKYPSARIISDGGHNSTGDIVKALHLGADFVMLGGMLAGTNEAEGGANYRGMASEEALSERKQDFFVEGISKTVLHKGSVAYVLKNIKDAIEKACYYTGSTGIAELRQAQKVFITSSSKIESYNRDINSYNRNV